MASATIARINAENLSVLLLRYVYQTMMRNADNSKRFPVISSLQDLTSKCVPNVVPIECGTNLNLKSIT